MICANCGSDQVASYCAHCGQNDRDYHRSLPPLLWDLLRETFEVDSHLLATLKLLLFQPGGLSLEFSNNRRASYVSPFRLYLFINLLFFLLVSLTTDISGSYRDVLVAEAELSSEAAVDTAYLYQLADPSQKLQLDEILSRPDPSISKEVLRGVASELVADSMVEGQLATDPATALTPFSRYMFGQLINAVADPRQMISGLVDNLPVVLFVILPIYALLLKLFYIKRHRYYIENLVFVTHLHSFAFVIYALMLLLPDDGWIDGLLIAILGIYHFVALRRYFGESNVRTLVKYSAQVAVYFLLLLPGIFVLLAVFTLATV